MNDAPAIKRRSFLTAALVLPAAAAVTAYVARRQPPLPVAAPAGTDVIGASGYHETEHIRKYYRSAAYF